jgi:hypothetical protein
MNNPKQTKPSETLLSPCVHYLADYLRKIDSNGLEIFLSEIESMESPVDMDTAGICWCLIETLRTRFQVDIIEMSGTSHDPIQTENLEDRENAFAVLERAECFGVEPFANEFMRLAPYVLFNIHPEDDDDIRQDMTKA